MTADGTMFLIAFYFVFVFVLPIALLLRFPYPPSAVSVSSDQSSSLSSSRAQQFDIKCAAVTAGGDILTASSDGRVQMFRFERRDRPVRGRAAHARPDRSSLARSNS